MRGKHMRLPGGVSTSGAFVIRMGARATPRGLVGDVLHVVDVWDSRDNMLAFMSELGPIVEESGMGLAEPEVGDLLQVVRTE